MVSPITAQNIIDRTQDLLQNYTTGSTDPTKLLRSVNSAIEYVKRRMTLPSDEGIQRFYYLQDTLFYDLDDDFNEGLAVLYDDTTKNDPSVSWEYRPYLELLRMTSNAAPAKNLFSWTPINGKWQLVMLGTNINQGSILDPMDNIGTFVAQNDATGLAVDNNIYKEGSGSLSFTMNSALGNGLGSVYWTVNQDYTKMLANNAYFKFYVYLADTHISSINLRLYSSATDYYALSATLFDDGSAFSTGLDTWKRVQLGFSGATTVGSPNIRSIINQRIDLVEGAGFASASGFRIDGLYSVYPDYMDFIYLSSYKGTDTTGATHKIFLDEVTDIPAFGNYVPDMIDVIALRAAVVMVPQILSNASFRSMYIAEHEEVMRVLGKSWPRKRVLNMGSLKLSR